MSSEPIKKALKDFGLTEKEAEIYIILAKHGVLTGGEISKQTKIHRPHVYRLLKKLQSKGVVEPTLEAPTRFTAVPFETILDLNIRAKREEVVSIEKSREDLLADWKRISKTRIEPLLGTFLVIEGNKRIYPKILQMIKETKNQLSVISTVEELDRAEQFGVFDHAYDHPLRPRVQFRFLTEISSENLKAVKLLKTKLRAGLVLKGRSPDLDLALFPRMVIRDDDEIMFFISRSKDETRLQQNEVCLCTDCESLVQAFTAVFEDLWRNSTDIEQKIVEIETGKSPPKTCILSDSDASRKQYVETLNSARKEVFLVTSSRGLVELGKNMTLLKDWEKRRLSIKIMAPIVGENLETAQRLARCCEVRHVPKGYVVTTIVDGQHLFQFKKPPMDQEKLLSTPYFNGAFYTNDVEYIKRASSMLEGIWDSARVPSAIPLSSLVGSPLAPFSKVTEKRPHDIMRKTTIHKGLQELYSETITEREVLEKIAKGKKYPARNWPNDVIKYYINSGFAFIHSPREYNLPDMILSVHHNNKQSSFGAEDWMLIFLWLDTPSGRAYVPVAVVLDNPKPLKFRKAVFRGTPAEQNFQVVKRDQLQVQLHGNTLFAGWTVEIPLLPPPYSLPPSCLLFEGFGDVKSGRFTSKMPSGVFAEYEYNALEAFFTFFHPAAKYTGPGTESFLHREIILTSHPPRPSE